MAAHSRHQRPGAGAAGDLDDRSAELDVIEDVGVGLVDIAEGADVLVVAEGDEIGPPRARLAVERDQPAGGGADDVTGEGAGPFIADMRRIDFLA